jgi:hypothetical protein
MMVCYQIDASVLCNEEIYYEAYYIYYEPDAVKMWLSAWHEARGGSELQMIP